MTIEWRMVPGFPGYEVSSMGDLRSRCDKHGGLRDEPVAILPWNSKRYVNASLYQKGKRKSRLLHRVVLESFVGPCPVGMEACHNNGNSKDNRLDNLRWDSKKNNALDKRSHGTLFNGERHHSAKLNPAKVSDICARFAAGGVTKTELAREHGV